jgi:hypothetical protein
MDETKLSRIRRCRECEHFISRPSQFAGANGFSAFCTYKSVAQELHDAYMEGPDENCLAGYWTGLAPIDLADEREANKQRKLANQRANMAPLVQTQLEGHTQVEIDGMLDVLVALQVLEPEIAVEISDELERQTPPISPSGPGR